MSHNYRPYPKGWGTVMFSVSSHWGGGGGGDTPVPSPQTLVPGPFWGVPHYLFWCPFGGGGGVGGASSPGTSQPGQVTLWVVRLVRFPAGGLSFWFVKMLILIRNHCTTTNVDRILWRKIAFVTFLNKFKPHQEQKILLDLLLICLKVTSIHD